MKHYVVHRNRLSECNCHRFQNHGKCGHVSERGTWQATYIVAATTAAQAEKLVGSKRDYLTSYPLPSCTNGDGEIVLEIWRDQKIAP